MRQDPDVIMVGEMRDKATVEAALTAAQTGHLVLSTLHTLDAIRTVNRIIDFFPPHERNQIRILLSESLLGILSQRLLPRADGPGRTLATEVLVNTPLIRDYIKDETKTPLIKDALMQDNLRGMQTFDQHLVELYLAGSRSPRGRRLRRHQPARAALMITQRAGGRDDVNEAEFEQAWSRAAGPVRG
jgi:twitching motility protein PilT